MEAIEEVPEKTRQKAAVPQRLAMAIFADGRPRSWSRGRACGRVRPRPPPPAAARDQTLCRTFSALAATAIAANACSLPTVTTSRVATARVTPAVVAAAPEAATRNETSGGICMRA